MATDPEDMTADIDFGNALSDRYLVYALSTITARSLPDVRDGLKPVHRRILWTMRALRLEPSAGALNNTAYKKCARVVGDTMGKFHPHGDGAIYDAMVRLAQDFSLRYPLVDGQGNFGNVDGDNAAAYRYTEARLTATAQLLMAGLDDGTVDFRPTYNGEDEEPEVFPGLFPNLLANGASGIAVGMATSIPPHNVGELIDAATHILDDPAAEDSALLDFVQGPDFPTGGVVVDNREAIASAYRTGRGAFRVRAGWTIEKGAQGSWAAVITEVPYGVQKGKLIEAIAALINDKKLPILADVRDESDSRIRVVLEPRSRTVDPQVLMDSLFRLTDLEVRVPLNLNVLDEARVPRVMSLKAALEAYLKHQVDVLLRRANTRIARIDDRLELVAGYLVAYLNLDRVIAIIRGEDEPKPVLMAEFALTDRQAEAILNMRLRSLRKLEEMELRKEEAALRKEREDLQKLIESPARQRTRIKRDLATLKARYEDDPRRTRIEEAAPTREIPLEAMIEREPITVILSQRGWIRALRGHLSSEEIAAQKFKEGDQLRFAFPAHTTDKLLLAADDGRFFTLAGDRLPGGRGWGEPVRLLIDLPAEREVIALFPARSGEKLLLAASDGRGFVAPAAALVAETRKGRQVVNLRPGAKLRIVRTVPADADAIAAIGDNRKMVVFPLSELPELGRGGGAALQKYRDGGLSDAIAFRFAAGLSWTMGGEGARTRTESDLTPWRVTRGAAGRMPPLGFPRDNRFAPPKP